MSEWVFIPPRGGGTTDPALLVNTYDYGAPYGNGGTDNGANVAAQWVFQEASGSLVDVVNGITLVSSAGSPTVPVYQVPMGKEYSTNHTQCLGLWVPGVGTRFWKNSATAALDIGTGSAVFEWVLSWRYGSHIGWRLDCRDSVTSPTQGYHIAMNANGAHDFYLQATDGTAVSRVGSVNITLTRKAFSCGAWAKLRYVVDRGANMCYFYIDGVLADSWSIATLSGKSIPCPLVSFGAPSNGTSNSVGRYAELRITIGNATNNSGGPGGG